MKKQYSEGIEEMLKRRTRQYALSVVRLVQALKRGLVADVLGRQLVRCGTSVGANYRSACRAKSKADMIAKLAIAEEEADESLYWLELLVESGELPSATAETLLAEGEEILRVLVSSIRTLKLSRDEAALVRETTVHYRADLNFQRDLVLPEIPKSKVQNPN